MRKFTFLLLLFWTQSLLAQHCPWDCSGAILLKTDVSAEEFRQLNPMLVNAADELIVDTVYGTGVNSYDTCRFLSYDDFLQYRTERIKLHQWYGYDTMYGFAKDHFLVRFNFCKFKKEESGHLFIRFTDPVSKEYAYFEIPSNHRIHLHDFNQEINKKMSLAEIPSLQPLVHELTRKEWNLPDK